MASAPPSVPRTRDDVTLAWLRSVLSPDDPNTLVSANVSALPAIGLLSTLVVANLEWVGAGPPAVVVKLGSTVEANTMIADQFGYYRREVGTYKHLLPHDAAWVPSCTYAAIDDDGLPVLVLDDLRHLRSGDQLLGLTTAEAEAAIDTAAAFHAHFWNAPSLHDHGWLPGPTDEVIAIYRDLFAMMWPKFRSGAGAAIDPEHLAAAGAAMDHFGEALERFTQAPQTLVHGDYRLDNLIFNSDGSAIAIDWQLAARGHGPYDLAFLLAGSANPSWRAETEAGLLHRYHAALVDHGVSGYSFDDCWHDYRLGHVLNLPNPVTAAVAVEPQDERGAELLRINAARALAAVADHW